MEIATLKNRPLKNDEVDLICRSVNEHTKYMITCDKKKHWLENAQRHLAMKWKLLPIYEEHIVKNVPHPYERLQCLICVWRVFISFSDHNRPTTLALLKDLKLYLKVGGGDQSSLVQRDIIRSNKWSELECVIAGLKMF